MSFEIECREPEMRDGFADDADPVFVIDPGTYFAITERDGVANYSDKPVRVSVQVRGVKTLIGFHG